MATVFGTSGRDLLTATSGDDLLAGLEGDDTLQVAIHPVASPNGSAGVDVFDGGSGFDVFRIAGPARLFVNFSDEAVAADRIPGEAVDLAANALRIVAGTSNDARIIDVEGAVGGEGADAFFGGRANERFEGGGGADILDGGAGADTLIGGSGRDLYVVDDLRDVILETAPELDDVRSAISFVLPAGFGNLTLTGTAALTGRGNAGDNVITGNDGANQLIGGGGADTLAGGLGADTYTVDSLDDVIVETGADVDTVRSSVSWVLGTDLENLVLVGNVGLSGTGNAAANRITGTAAGDTLDGGLGSDTLEGGAGVDTASFASLGSEAVIVALGGAGAGTARLVSDPSVVDVLTGIENVTGTAGDDSIRGDGYANRLDGGAGSDTLAGGLGDDVYVVDAFTAGSPSLGDVVIEQAGGGRDTVLQASEIYELAGEVEILRVIAAGATVSLGNGLGNRMEGNDFANLLDGLGGNDTMIGGAGSDTYRVDSAGDLVVEVQTGGAADLVETFISYTLPAWTENLLGKAAGLKLTGNALANVITAAAGGGDTLDGGLGADTLSGGDGDDRYIVDDAGDLVIEEADSGNDTVVSSVSFALDLPSPDDVNGLPTATIENLVLVGAAELFGIGNALANQITGNAGANRLRGGAGADTLDGGAGSDTLDYSDAVDAIAVVLSGAGAVALQGTDAAIAGDTAFRFENVIGGAGDDSLTGDAGANHIDGGAGADTLTGGLGNDTYALDNAGDVVVEAAGGGIDRVVASVSRTLEANVENLMLVGLADIDGTGNAAANRIEGNGGANVLDGGAGADTLVGGRGNDVYVVDNQGDLVVEDPITGGIDTVRASISYRLGNGLENLELTGNAALSATGNAAANRITGNDGANRIDGGLGADTLIGGRGDDTYIVDSSLDVVTEEDDAAFGNDTVQSSANFELAAGVENLVLLGTAALNGTGNAGANRIVGNAGANLIRGGLGADTLIGGLGADTLVYGGSSLGDVVLRLNGSNEVAVDGSHDEASGDRVAGFENVVSGLGDDRLTGDGLANRLEGGGGTDTLDGGAGNDTLDGGVGADSLVGGLGDDVFVVDDAGDVVIEIAGGGIDRVQSSISFDLSAPGAAGESRAFLEHLDLIGALGLAGTGNALGNRITGTGGNDTLDGGRGADTLVGGAGNDVYHVDQATDVIVEAVNGGLDRVISSAASYVLSANIEELILTGAAVGGTGNAQNNSIIGTTGANRLDGGAGEDTLDGFGGLDTLIGGSGNDVYDNVTESGVVIQEALNGGIDLVRSLVSLTLSTHVENLDFIGAGSFVGTGNALANRLRGGSGSDTLIGGGGDDTLIGGDGDDSLDGGIGADRFEFGAAFGSDTVAGFVFGQGSGDVLAFDRSIFATRDDALAAIQSGITSGADLVVDIGADRLTLRAVDRAMATLDDFLIL